MHKNPIKINIYGKNQHYYVAVQKISQYQSIIDFEVKIPDGMYYVCYSSIVYNYPMLGLNYFDSEKSFPHCFNTYFPIEEMEKIDEFNPNINNFGDDYIFDDKTYKYDFNMLDPNIVKVYMEKSTYAAVGYLIDHTISVIPLINYLETSNLLDHVFLKIYKVLKTRNITMFYLLSHKYKNYIIKYKSYIEDNDNRQLIDAIINDKRIIIGFELIKNGNIVPFISEIFKNNNGEMYINQPLKKPYNPSSIVLLYKKEQPFLFYRQFYKKQQYNNNNQLILSYPELYFENEIYPDEMENDFVKDLITYHNYGKKIYYDDKAMEWFINTVYKPFKTLVFINYCRMEFWCKNLWKKFNEMFPNDVNKYQYKFKPIFK